MKRTLKTITYIILIILVLVCSVGCDDSEAARLYFELPEKPTTLDAQTASSDSELLIVRNIFEGLLRKDQNGKIVCGAAESYTKSGLVYTFKLRDGMSWSDGTRITSDDFVYGLQRALTPSTRAPFAERLYSIKNAKEFNSHGAGVDDLGVWAPDKSTVVIELSREDGDFTDVLTTSVAMPCNRKFFAKCRGKYGLDSENILSNGSYSITKWNKEDFGIRIYKNEEYSGEFEAKNYGVLISCRDEKTPLELLVDNSIDMTFLANSYVTNAKENNINIKSYQNICWVMRINERYSENLRSAFMSLVSPTVYDDSLPVGFTSAASLYPAVLGIKDADGVGLTPYNREQAWSTFTKEVAALEDKKFPPSTLTYLENDEIKAAITAQIGHWQQHLNAFINLKGEDDKAFTDIFSREDIFDFSLFPITAKCGSVSEYLKNFNVEGAEKSPSEIQAELLKSNTLVPFAFENTNVAYTSALENVFCEPQNGYVDFSFIIKHE